MNTIKAGFGVIMLGVAIYMLDRVPAADADAVLWALLVFFTGVFIGAFEPLPANPTAGAPLREGHWRARLPVRRAAVHRRDRSAARPVLEPIPRARR